MSIKLGVAESTVSYLKPRIAVVGVGGGGGNAVNNMISENLEGVDFIVANTDAQALAHSTASQKIQLGLEITQGLGAGARPEVGKMAAEEARDKISEVLEGVNMVFITAGMGGGTGSGAAPVVAHIAKEKGILTVGVVTKPFSFEGRKRMEIAENALANFTKEVDSIIIIPNQNLFRIADENTTLADAFKLADNVLYSGVRSITDLMMMPGLINLDFADVKNIMQDKGKAIMGTGEAEGKGRAKEAARQALANPLLDDCSMLGAKGVLINITGGTDITLPELDEAANTIKEEVGDDANIIFGSSFDDNLSGKIRVSIVVTGINDEKLPNVEAKPRVAEPSLIDQSYDDSTFVPTVEPVSKSDIFTDNDTFANTEVAEQPLNEEIDEYTPSISEIEQETIEPINLDDSFDEKIESIDDFADLDKSDELPEVPQASALFSAIMNNNGKDAEDDKIDLDFDVLTNKGGDFFASNTSIQDIPVKIDEEPELFRENDVSAFKDLASENEPKEENVVADDASVSTKPTSFIDRFMGISLARRKNNEESAKQDAKFADNSMQDNDTDDIELSSDDLDIPSFLRRK
ncbi:MAG: cell division protein FtsZ [Alphaproteobacteria bacterium]|nr:cell division protein FtsZ [Alphaproteobacteria bacterium]